MSTTLIHTGIVFVSISLIFAALVITEAAAEKLVEIWRRRRKNCKTDAKTAD